MSDISKKVDDHLYLNKSAILSEYMDRPKPGSILTLNDRCILVYIDHSDNLCVFILSTGEEFKIPNIMIVSLKNLRLEESINAYKGESGSDNLIIILSYLSNLSGKNIDTVINLLFLIKENDLLTKDIRDMIHKRLGIIPNYISYSSPTDYQFY